MTNVDMASNEFSPFDKEIETLRAEFGGNLRLSTSPQGDTLVNIDYYPDSNSLEKTGETTAQNFKCIKYEITVSKDYLNSKPRPEFIAKLDLLNTEFSAKDRAKLAKQFYIQASINKSPVNPICSAIKKANETIKFLINHGSSDQPSQEPSNSNITFASKWTVCEQTLLESALKSVDVKRGIDWSVISKKVGTKTEKECLERFKYCLEKLRSSSSSKCESTLSSSAPDCETAKANSTATGEQNEIECANVSGGDKNEISCINATLIGIQSYRASHLKIELLCKRCKTCFSCSVKIPETESRAGCGYNCKKCKSKSSFYFSPDIGFLNSSKIGTIETINCAVKDILECDYWIVCEKCAEKYSIHGISQGGIKKVACRNCYQGLQFGYQQISINDTLLKSIKRTPALDPESSGKKGQPQLLNLKVGNPLPLNGACRHYKKSFRWLRFPCCGRAFPCDICHDKETGHKCEMAKLMICGFCSTLQSFSNKPCQACTRAPTASSSSHWEGGKGCRDPVKLSRKDSKKYKLIGKK